MNSRVAVVDNDAESRSAVKAILSRENISVDEYSCASEALIHFKSECPDLLITCHKMKNIDGFMLLKKMKDDYPDVLTIIITSSTSIESATHAMELGAFNYIARPVNDEQLLLLAKRALEKARLKNENKNLREQLGKSFNLDPMIGKSPAMFSVFELIKLVASASANVLITGESGTGKELVARALHYSGIRKEKSFIPINCTAIPEQLLESELFGHMKGSFTGAINNKIGLFEEAEGGTLFLDEIGDLSLSLQAKLLRVIQDKQVRAVGGNELKQIDVRIVSASNQDLRVLVHEGKFREDLFYRLNVVPIKVPPLRDRMADIPILVQSFIKKFAAQNHSRVKGIAADALAILMGYSWPGNVRELENVIERAMVLSPGEQIEKNIIIDSALEETKQSVKELLVDRPTLERLEERYIKLVLKETHNKKDEAAQILGVSRRTLYRKEQLYGTSPNYSKEYSDNSAEQFL